MYLCYKDTKKNDGFPNFLACFSLFFARKMAFFAFCCHAATLLPRLKAPLHRCISKDSWQRGSKIGNFIFFLPAKNNFRSEKNEFRPEYSIFNRLLSVPYRKINGEKFGSVKYFSYLCA